MGMVLIGLLLKIAMTAGIVVAASIVVERTGPFIGALIAALPTAGGAALIILAFEHPPQFIAHSAIGSLVANAACALFALTYAGAGAAPLVAGEPSAALSWCGSPACSSRGCLTGARPAPCCSTR